MSTRKIAYVAIVLSILSYVSHRIALITRNDFWGYFFGFSIILTIIGFSISIVILFSTIELRKEKIITKIIASIAIILSAYTFGDAIIKNLDYIPSETLCASNLNSIHKALITYAADNKDCYPTANKWCDLLIKEADVLPKLLKCPNDKKGPSSYAINPNVEPNSPENVVLIFESKPGWNQSGGKELLNSENHKGEGASVLLNNGAVLFIKKEDFDKLNWGTPQEPNKIQNIK